uniref:F-box domain-containing protein n=1 Tax=Setaria italica TaxID=4555 RepID=K3ZMC4_SETIT
MRPEKKSKNVPAASGSDRIDALPDDVLEHIIGFLPVDEAGRTSVLARRWRHLWKYATALRIRCVEDDACFSHQRGLKHSQDPEAIDGMLRLRGRAPLQVCELTFDCFYKDDDVVRLNRWVRHVVMCQVQRFRLENFYAAEFMELDNLPLVSRHLTRLELVGLLLNSDFCDFSSCPSLQHLELSDCYFRNVKRLSSDSVKWLSMTDCNFSTESSTLILVPSLVSLRLHAHLYRPPILGSMPLLQEAYVRVPLLDNFPMVCEEENCYSCHDIMDNNKCALLNGLSNAEKLALLSESTTFIFKSDLKQCPTFSKLKTLLLNDHWCVPPDFSALTCILKNSPVLEMLVLQLFSKEHDHIVEIEGRYHPMVDRSAVISKDLKAIKIKCEAVDENVHKILKFMCTLNIFMSSNRYFNQTILLVMLNYVVTKFL